MRSRLADTHRRNFCQSGIAAGSSRSAARRIVIQCRRVIRKWELPGYGNSCAPRARYMRVDDAVDERLGPVSIHEARPNYWPITTACSAAGRWR